MWVTVEVQLSASKGTEAIQHQEVWENAWSCAICSKPASVNFFYRIKQQFLVNNNSFAFSSQQRISDSKIGMYLLHWQVRRLSIKYLYFLEIKKMTRQRLVSLHRINQVSFTQHIFVLTLVKYFLSSIIRLSESSRITIWSPSTS